MRYFNQLGSAAADAEAVEFRVLGPLQVRRGDEVLDLGSAKQRALLAALLCRANSVVPISDLVEVLWPDGAPRTALKNIQVYASGLRKTVLHGRARALDYRAPGYQLSLAESDLDVAKFDALTRQGRSRLRAGDPGHASALLRAALELWRGPALEEFSAYPVLRREADRLAARRLEAYEDLIDAQLALGSARDVLDEIEDLSRAYPVRERLRSLQMSALYQSSRTVEALAVFEEVRQTLAHELGLSPSPALQRQYQSMLAGERPATTAPMLWLPRALTDFTGRRGQLDELLRTLRVAPALAVVHGLPGVGKTTLAVHAAHQLRSDYPDGQFLVRLRDTDGSPRAPAVSLAELLTMLGVEATARYEHDLAALHACLADRRVLVILDDAAQTRSVRPLLPRAGRSAVIVTSRRLLALDSACYLRLDPFTVSEALTLLDRIIGTARISNDPGAAERVVRRSRLLPLAIRIAGTKFVARPDAPLNRLSYADSGVDRSVRALLGDLTAEERLVLGRLARGPATLGAVAASLGRAPQDVEPVLECLIQAHSATEDGADDADPQYRVADLLRPYPIESNEGKSEPDSYRTLSRHS